MKRVYIMSTDIARRNAVQAVQEAQPGYWVTISEPKKSREQEEKYHAMIGEIADAMTLHGKKLDAESWKRLLIDAFKHDTQNDPDLSEEWKAVGSIELLPALNHSGFVMVGAQSRKFSKKLATAFIEWLGAFMAENGVGECLEAA